MSSLPSRSTMIPRLLLAGLALTALACGGGGTEPPSPASIVAVTSNPVGSATVGSALPGVPTFEVRSSAGRALAGIAVTVSVTAGGGTLAGAPSITLGGAPTPIGQWTLGTTAGAQTVTVSAANLTPLVFTATATPGAATQLQLVEGDDQFGTQNAPTFLPLRVRARDQFNNVVPGAQVTWVVDAGGGALAAASSVTDANGIATAPTWTLGTAAAGEQAVVASLAGQTVRFTATAQNAPASLVVVQGAPASATVFSPLAPAPSFEVRDAGDVALPGVPVTVAITAGNGTLTGAPTVSAAGTTSIGTWRLGQTAGTQTVTVTVAGLPPVSWTVSAVPDVPAQLAVVAGAAQSAFAGAALPIAPLVRLTDQYGNAIANAAVDWLVTAGGGSVTALPTVTTNVAGEASAGTWTLGRRGGAQALRATSGALQQVVTATIQSNYTITLRFVGTEPTGSIAQAFADAKARLEAMLVGDLPEILIAGPNGQGNFNVSQCNASFTSVPGINEVVDDVLIYASVEPIDGVGQVLGSAGPCVVRTNGRQAVLGTMRFDSADLQNLASLGRLGDIITHEMLHVVGLGTMWNDPGVNLLTGANTSDTRVIGALAAAACANDLGGATACPGYVPAEDCEDLAPGTNCGAGTRNSHWKESTFRTELMTGFAGATNLLSRMTIQGMADLGYGVNLLAADPYTVPPALMGALRVAGDVHAELSGDIALPTPTLPRFEADRSGRMRAIVRR